MTNNLRTTGTQSLPKALYTGLLPIGNLELECAVLDNGERILSLKSVFAAFSRPRRGANNRLVVEGTRIPPFLASKCLEPYIGQDVIERTKVIEYLDGKFKKRGYVASLLPKMCEIYLVARREGKLSPLQRRFAEQSEILLSALAQVGIDALVDEVTGHQKYRTGDALRLLLAKYLEEGLQKWIQTFPNSFFAELARLYGNEPINSRKRPQYYGHFINKYVYKPIEKGYLKAELNERNIDKVTKKRIARFHQWLSDHGRAVLQRQIGKVQGLMEVADNIEEFRKLAAKQKGEVLSPELLQLIENEQNS